MADVCAGCRSTPANAFLGDEGPFCDPCLDERISAATGWPRLPAPPQPRVVTGPDGREHRLRFRLWRTPGGISAEAVEQVADGEGTEGYELKVFGDHNADPARLVAELDERVRAEMDRCYLEPAYHQGWQVAGTEVAGRVSWAEDGTPDIIIDGRRISWDEFGRMVTAFDGWWFRLGFGDDHPPPQPARRQNAAHKPVADADQAGR